MKIKRYILLTVDVEDWFQVENFKPWIPFDRWDSYELRVERNVHRLLDLFDSMSEICGLQCLDDRAVEGQRPEVGDRRSEDGGRRSDVRGQRSEVRGQRSEKEELRSDVGSRTSEGNRQKAEDVERVLGSDISTSPNKPMNPPRVRATFFILGWIAERLPGMVQEIQKRGHEVASHGYGHEMCNMQDRLELERDLTDSKKLLEDIVGNRVYGYRAPSFSVNREVLNIIEQCGYSYDSSYNSFGMHGRYGFVNFSDYAQSGIAYRLSENFYELPVSNLEFSIQHSKLVFPWGGGGYFRLIPSWIFNAGVRSILNRKHAYLFYMHPWEIDPGQPRMDAASKGFKFRHYINLKKANSKLKRLIEGTAFCEFATCQDYLSTVIR